MWHIYLYVTLNCILLRHRGEPDVEVTIMKCQNLIQTVGNDAEAQIELAQLVAGYMREARCQERKTELYDMLERLLHPEWEGNGHDGNGGAIHASR